MGRKFIGMVPVDPEPQEVKPDRYFITLGPLFEGVYTEEQAGQLYAEVVRLAAEAGIRLCAPAIQECDVNGEPLQPIVIPPGLALALGIKEP